MRIPLFAGNASGSNLIRIKFARKVLSGEYRHRVRSKAALVVDIIRTAHTDKYRAGAQMVSLSSSEKAGEKGTRQTTPARLEPAEIEANPGSSGAQAPLNSEYQGRGGSAETALCPLFVFTSRKARIKTARVGS